MKSQIDNNLDLRDAFFSGVYDIISNDKNSIILTADHGAFLLNKIAADFPNQFLNVGISEQNMISVAAGLASCGKKVYTYSINNFTAIRALEQINLDICANNLDVNMIGVGAGFTYSTDGPSHHGLQDMAAVINLPNVAVYNVSDAPSSLGLARLSRVRGPKYFRIEKGKNENLYTDDFSFESGIGAFYLSDNPETIIVSTGEITQTAVSVARHFRNCGTAVGVLDLFRVKPINEELLLKSLSGVKNVICLEENLKSGGINEKLSSIFQKNKSQFNFRVCAVEDQFCYHYGTRDQLRKKYGIDEDSLIKMMETNFGTKLKK